ncbi:MAG: alpha amylase C-terminal domain-containing protein [Phycisphaerae bacterium]
MAQNTNEQSTAAPPDGTGLIRHDPWLGDYADKLRRRYARYRDKLAEIERSQGNLFDFALGHRYYGLNRGRHNGDAGLWYREWAPGAQSLALIGDFNHWNRDATPLTRNEFGVWEVFLPDGEYRERLKHESRIKVHVVAENGALDRLPAYLRRAIYEPEAGAFTGQYWNPQQPYTWRHAVPESNGSLRIYEAHVGIALEAHRVGSYREFADFVLPRIEKARYNAIQLMAVQEHPYYASFGYQVSNFFAPSSRFGTPEDLKYLIDEAHGRGIRVLLDIVHSHAVKNIYEGLNRFDGTEYQYFHGGARGLHPAWDSLCFDYGKWEVLRFLLSNCRYWLEEFHFDGFRFDGVTSMMYTHHGMGPAFDHYDKYLAEGLDEDAITYLQLANKLVHDFRPDVTTIAEDVSGMIGIAAPLDDGGIGFDYRLAMGLPDFWIEQISKKRDEDWRMEQFWGAMTNRRAGEKHVAYVESHDQALVGDKTLAFWLMDSDMYTHMAKGKANLRVARGMALHKMIRLLTFAAGGDAYLTFMGNEFGHPEWIDFPRQGNQWSFHYARRQWSLVDNSLLRYRDLGEFDRAMLKLDDAYRLFREPSVNLLMIHEDFKLLVFERAGIVFAFNFHATDSRADLELRVPAPRDYRVVLNTDDLWFGGHAIVEAGQVYPAAKDERGNFTHSVRSYLPARTAQVLAPQ